MATVTGLEPASTHRQCVSLTRCLHGHVVKVETRGIEPLTYTLPACRSPS